VFYKEIGTNSKRHKLSFKKFLLCLPGHIDKPLKLGKKNYVGRSRQTGHITSWHKGGGVKALHRKIEPFPSLSLILGVVYSPVHTSFLALGYNFFKKSYNYSIAPENSLPGSLLHSYATLPELNLGTNVSLRNTPAGSVICNIGLGLKTQYIKAAGASGVVVSKEKKICTVRLPSGSLKSVPLHLTCSLGSVSNAQRNRICIGKAGTSRLLGRRPIVRGVAMNPVDHPHGGQTSGGTVSKTPWGIPTKGKKTVKYKKTQLKIF
jgi:large subunit ribosomal protein L2